MPGEDADGLALGDKFPAELELAPDPDMVAGHPEFGGERLTFPDVPAIEKRTGLHRHVILRVDGPGDGDLVEQVKEIQFFIKHDGGAEDRIGSGLLKFLKGLG